MKRTLDSVAAQTYKSFEVIVADDGSTDGTEELVRSYEGKFPLKYSWEQNWGGPARPRNRAAAMAIGEWLAFLDSDDLWYPNKLEEIAKHLDGYDVVYHAMEELGPEGIAVRKKCALALDSVNPFMDLFVKGNRLGNSATCVKRSVFQSVGGVREDRGIVAVEDYDLWLRLAKCGFKFRAIDDVLSQYVVGHDNISQLSPKFVRAWKQVITINSDNLNFYYRRSAHKFIKYACGMRALRSNNQARALGLFLRAALDVPDVITLKSVARIGQILFHLPRS